MKKVFPKFLILLILFVGVSLFKYFHLEDYLTFDYLKSNQDNFRNYYLQNQFQTLVTFFILYIIVTSLSLPGATLLTLAGGGMFGLTLGVFVISFASSIGATLAFLSSRYLLRDFVQKKWEKSLVAINKGIEEDGLFYLLTLRLIPAFPFFMINLVMGLTSIKMIPFFFISQLGMLAATIVYVNAGLQISQLDSLDGILSIEVLGSFILLALLPFIGKMIVKKFKKFKV